MTAEIKTGEFYYSKSFRSVAKVIEISTLWGSDYAHIWLPNSRWCRQIISAHNEIHLICTAARKERLRFA